VSFQTGDIQMHTWIDSLHSTFARKIKESEKRTKTLLLEKYNLSCRLEGACQELVRSLLNTDDTFEKMFEYLSISNANTEDWELLVEYLHFRFSSLSNIDDQLLATTPEPEASAPPLTQSLETSPQPLQLPSRMESFLKRFPGIPFIVFCQAEEEKEEDDE